MRASVPDPPPVLGYKGTARFGLMWLVYYGGSLSLDDPIDGEPTLHAAMGFGVGWKL